VTIQKSWAAFETQSPVTAALGGTPFSAFSVPSMAMIVYTGIYLLVALVVAINTFQHRDI
jgi:hypothetical protein